jgi:hypothetical protein
VSHWWNRLSHRWNKLCRPWNTGPYSFLSYSYIYNSDCPFTVSFNLDQSQPDKIIHCPDSRTSRHSSHLRRQHDLSTNLLPSKRLNQNHQS